MNMSSPESDSGYIDGCIVQYITLSLSILCGGLYVNCILEAFGHASTPVNDNSSRFIKLLSLQYCDKRRTLLRGTHTHNYSFTQGAVL